MTWMLEWLLAGPLAAIGVWMMLAASLRPREVGLIQLAFCFFTLQFIMGVILIPPLDRMGFDRMAIIRGWYAIWLFWIAVCITARAWKSPLPHLVYQLRPQTETTQGVFSHIMAESLRIRPLHLLLMGLVVHGLHVAMHMKYGIVLSGSFSFGEMMAVPYPVRALNSVVKFAGIGVALLAVAKIATRQPGRVLCFMVIAMETAYMFTRGRRFLFAFIIAGFLVYLIPRMRMKMKHAVIIIVCVALLWNFFFPLFVSVRKQWQINPDAPVSVWFSDAINDLRDDSTVTVSTLSLEDEGYSSIEARLRAANSIYVVAEAQQQDVPNLRGRVFLGSLVGAVPHAIFPWKRSFHVYEDEAINSRYHVQTASGDLSTFMPMTGLADFGLLGALLYGVVFVIIIRLAQYLYLGMYKHTPLAACIAMGIFIIEVPMQMEHMFLSEITTLRSMLIVMVLALIWRTLAGGFAATFAYAQPVPPRRPNAGDP